MKEVFADPTHDESLIFELLDMKHDVQDSESAAWFLQDLATVQDAAGSLVTPLLVKELVSCLKTKSQCSQLAELA